MEIGKSLLNACEILKQAKETCGSQSKLFQRSEALINFHLAYLMPSEDMKHKASSFYQIAFKQFEIYDNYKGMIVCQESMGQLSEDYLMRMQIKAELSRLKKEQEQGRWMLPKRFTNDVLDVLSDLALDSSVSVWKPNSLTVQTKKEQLQIGGKRIKIIS